MAAAPPSPARMENSSTSQTVSNKRERESKKYPFLDSRLVSRKKSPILPAKPRQGGPLPAYEALIRRGPHRERDDHDDLRPTRDHC